MESAIIGSFKYRHEYKSGSFCYCNESIDEGGRKIGKRKGAAEVTGAKIPPGLITVTHFVGPSNEGISELRKTISSYK
jgi:hypothetical protein